MTYVLILLFVAFMIVWWRYLRRVVRRSYDDRDMIP